MRMTNDEALMMKPESPSSGFRAFDVICHRVRRCHTSSKNRRASKDKNVQKHLMKVLVGLSLVIHCQIHLLHLSGVTSSIPSLMSSVALFAAEVSPEGKNLNSRG